MSGPTGEPLRGSMTALATPFNAGAIDYVAFEKMCERQVERGTTALVVCGSTGEAAALGVPEQAELIYTAAAVAGRRTPVIAGCGGLSTEAAVTAAISAARAGADMLLCAPTPYVKPSQEGIVAHIDALARATELPIIAYDVPSRTGVAIRDETVARLFKDELIVGIKDATADLGRPPRLRALCGDGLAQLSGDDATAAAYRAAGGHGCISVTANLTPALCALLHGSWDRGDIASFACVRDRLSPLHNALFIESNPVPLKAALAMLNLADDDLRLPLVRAGQTTRDRLAELLARIMSVEESVAEHMECPADIL